MRYKFNHQLVNQNKPKAALFNKGKDQSDCIDDSRRVCRTQVPAIHEKDMTKMTPEKETETTNCEVTHGAADSSPFASESTLCVNNSEMREDVELVQVYPHEPGDRPNKQVGTRVRFKTSSPIREDIEDSNDGRLEIVVPESPVQKKRRFKEVSLDMNKEIEEEIEHQLEKKAKKTNLTVANVKSILRHVIGNEDVLAMVERSMQTSFSNGSDRNELCYDLKLTRAKTKELLQTQPAMVWPLTPVKKMPDSEHLVLINEELPDESDDEDYKPNLEDLHDHSEDETGRHSVVSTISQSSTLNSSIGQFFDSFDPGLLDEGSHHQAAASEHSVFKMPEENIGQRTRSKLCLSDTPLEAIEQAFVPPDITTDMYDYKCDNEDWENFLKDFMQPLSNDKDDDDDADPEYNVLAEEEEVDKEELRRDKAVKIPRKELRKLMAELFECPDEMSSDEEEEQRVQTEITQQMDGYLQEWVQEEGRSPEQDTGVTQAQRLLIQQQMRQHVQLTTQHFLQTYRHPVLAKHAQQCKIILATLVELGKLDDKSVYNVYNLRKAFRLVEKWERFLSTGSGSEVVRHMEDCVAVSLKRKREHMTFHKHLLDWVVKSDVFLYPLLLPSRCFRAIECKKLAFASAEDSLIAIGLEEFTEYIAHNPLWFNRKKYSEKAAIQVMCEYLMPVKTAPQIVNRIRTMKSVPGNPLEFYRKHSVAPPTQHFVIPFNNLLLKSPNQRPRELLPQLWQDHVYPELNEENKENSFSVKNGPDGDLG